MCAGAVCDMCGGPSFPSWKKLGYLVASGCWKKLGCTLLLEETWLHVVAAGDGFFQALLQVVVVQAVFSIRI